MKTPKKLPLAKASQLAQVPLVELLQAATNGTVPSEVKQQKVTFNLDDIMAWKGYLSYSAARSYLRNQGNPDYRPRRIIREGLQEGKIQIYQFPSGAFDAEKRPIYPTYIQKSSLDTFVEQWGEQEGRRREEEKQRREQKRYHRRAKVEAHAQSVESAIECLHQKLQERGFTTISRPTPVRMRNFCYKNKLSFPPSREELESAVDRYCQRFYDPKEYVTTEEAARSYLDRLKQEGVELNHRTNYTTVHERFQQWIRQKHLVGTKFLDPHDGHEKYCIKHEDLWHLINQSVQAHHEQSINHERRLQRNADYWEILELVGALRKGVQNASHVRLPERLFMKKPTGTYASISYNREEKYSHVIGS